MNLTISIDGILWSVQVSEPIDISIPLDFYGSQPSAFSLPEASSVPVAAGTFVGDTRRGGSANCETVSLNPHANGTHTECVGHISQERYAVAQALRESWIPATVLTISPERLAASKEHYDGVHRPDDLVITRRSLADSLAEQNRPEFMNALIVRSLPNLPAKKSAHHSGANPVYLTNDAMQWIRDQGVRHLLVDIPSVDREEDGGNLSNHRLFWDLAVGQSLASARQHETITEMIYVPDSVEDGFYLLNLQIPNFVLDAAPSRPILFALKPA